VALQTGAKQSFQGSHGTAGEEQTLFSATVCLPSPPAAGQFSLTELSTVTTANRDYFF